MELRDPVVIGRINAPHGVRGALKVKPLGSGSHLRRGVEPIVGGERRRILTSRKTPKGFLVELDGVIDRVSAGALRGEELMLDRGELDEPEEGEFYVSDLVGLDALDLKGRKIGVVAETYETPAYEVLVVRSEGADEDTEDLYVPFTEQHVPEVDPGERRVVVVLPEI